MVSETLTWLHAVKPLSYGSDSQAVASDPTKTINPQKNPTNIYMSFWKLAQLQL